MKIAINLNDRGYLHDYVDMGVSLIMAGSDYSVLTPVKFSIEELKEIKDSEHLKPQETKTFIDNSFRDGQVRTTGTDIDKILPPMSRFGGSDNRQEKKKTVVEKLQAFFERYFGL